MDLLRFVYEDAIRPSYPIPLTDNGDLLESVNCLFRDITEHLLGERRDNGWFDYEQFHTDHGSLLEKLRVLAPLAGTRFDFFALGQNPDAPCANPTGSTAAICQARNGRPLPRSMRLDR